MKSNQISDSEKLDLVLGKIVLLEGDSKELRDEFQKLKTYVQEKVDMFFKETTDIRGDKLVLANHVRDHEERLQKVEEHIFPQQNISPN